MSQLVKPDELRRLMAKAGMDRQQTAVALDFSIGYVSMLLSGQRTNPSRKFARAFAACARQHGLDDLAGLVERRAQKRT